MARPGHAVAVVAVVWITAVNYVGVQKSALVTRVIVVAVLAVLAAVVVAAWVSPVPSPSRLAVSFEAGPLGVLQGAGLLFFAFAGYARIATLGEEVVDPARTIPRAIPLALAIVLGVYALVATAALGVLGSEALASSQAPLADLVAAAGAGWLVPVVRVGAAVAATGSLLSLVLGVSRTTLAMARDGHLPGTLAAVHPRYQVPHHAELVVGAVVAGVAAFVDLRGAIGFSSFGVLLYYSIANASALTLRRDEGRPLPPIPIVGLVGCLGLAALLPVTSVGPGLAVVLLGAVLYGVRPRRRTGSNGRPDQPNGG